MTTFKKKMTTAALFLASAGSLFLAVGSASATPTTILDTYFGADPTHNYEHVDSIGGNAFDLTKMVVDFTSGGMTVDIHSTSYFSQTLPYENTLLGDLFISTNGFSTTLGDPSKTDTRDSGEQWEYVAVLDNRTGFSGSISLFSVDKTKILGSNLNGLPEEGWIYRANQEWAYNSLNEGAIGGGTWARSNNMLSFSFNIPQSWQNPTQFGFHWGMSCGNDIIEGGATAPVPEPATMLLFGTGLAGLAGLSRRRKNK